jgi:GTPase KRas
VTFEEGQNIAEKLGCAFEECSAKECVNVEKAMFDLVRKVRRQRVEEDAMRVDRRRRKEREAKRRNSL